MKPEVLVSTAGLSGLLLGFHLAKQTRRLRQTSSLLQTAFRGLTTTVPSRVAHSPCDCVERWSLRKVWCHSVNCCTRGCSLRGWTRQDACRFPCLFGQRSAIRLAGARTPVPGRATLEPHWVQQLLCGSRHAARKSSDPLYGAFSRVHLVCGAGRAVLFRANKNGSKLIPAICLVSGVSFVVDVFSVRIFPC